MFTLTTLTRFALIGVVAFAAVAPPVPVAAQSTRDIGAPASDTQALANTVVPMGMPVAETAVEKMGQQTWDPRFNAVFFKYNSYRTLDASSPIYHAWSQTWTHVLTFPNDGLSATDLNLFYDRNTGFAKSYWYDSNAQIYFL
ncbi:MAG: hypothetical protein ACT4QE_14780, partial [Anaerolineales bacterium]